VEPALVGEGQGGTELTLLSPVILSQHASVGGRTSTLTTHLRAGVSPTRKAHHGVTTIS
jgi:hypothetical protein